MSEGPFPVDEALLLSVSARLRAHPGLRFLLGGAGSGKTTVARAMEASLGVDVIDMDARIYGDWGGRWDAARHPATLAWLSAPDPLAWQLALEPDDFLRYHAAASVEALDLLAAELAGSAVTAATLVDGGFGSVAIVARAASPGAVVCLDLPPGSSSAVWASSPERRGFLDVVAAVDAVPDPVARFLALGDAMAERMVDDARAAGVPVVVGGGGRPVASTVAAVAETLGLG